MDDEPVPPRARNASWSRSALVLTCSAILGVVLGVLGGEPVMQALSRLGT